MVVRTSGEWVEHVKIYTKTGDDGITGLLGRGRVPKDDLRDRGVWHGRRAERRRWAWPARMAWTRRPIELVAQLQDELFVVGSALADPTADGTVPQRHHRAARRASGDARSTGSRPS